MWDGGKQINQFTHHIHLSTVSITLILYRTCDVQTVFLLCSAVKTFGFRDYHSCYAFLSSLILFCAIRTILEKMGLQGKVTPLQAKKKWDNLKKRYKVCVLSRR